MVWSHPVARLALLSLATLLLFGDRGVISCNGVQGRQATDGVPGTGIQGEFDLDFFQDGFIATAMMVGIMISAPLSAQLSKRLNAIRLVGGGLGLWSLGAGCCALAPGYTALLAARGIVGLGCGPFISLAAPIVDDAAPRASRSLWLAILFLCIPSGFAFGFIWAGLVASHFGWRAAFMAEAGLMVPFALLALLAPTVETRPGPATGKGGKPAGGAGWQDEARPPAGALREAAHDLAQLLRLRITVLAMLGLSLYTGGLGALSFYGPKAARDVLGLQPEVADVSFGAITIVAGVLGTLSGGLLLDRVGPSVRSALAICAASVAAATALLLAAFAAASTFGRFCSVLAAGELAMFLMAAPANAVLMWSVPKELRAFALSIAEISQHVFGDIPSPPLIGWLQSRYGSWRLSMSVCVCLLGTSACVFLLARLLAGGGAQYREVVAEPDEEGLPEGEGRSGDADQQAEQGSSSGGGAGGSGRRPAAAAGPSLEEPLLLQG